MPLYVCRFCNYTNITKYKYYAHYHTHINLDNICTFSHEEIQLCEYYYNKKTQRNREYTKNNKAKIAEYDKQYRQNNKEKIYLKNKNYRQNNKDKVTQYDNNYRQKNKEKIYLKNKNYRLKKLEIQEDNILDISDNELIISDSD